MINFTKQKSFGRITSDKSVNESFEIAKNICNELKLKIKNIDEARHLIEGKTKTSFVKNKFGEVFFVLVRPTTSSSVIDIFYNGIGVTGTDAGPLIQPFYKKFMEKTGTTPELETYLFEITDEQIKDEANSMVLLEEESVSKGSLPQGVENSSEDSFATIPNQQTLVSTASNESMSSSSNEITTVQQLKQLVARKHDQFKAQWDKNGIIQFKNEHVAILQRSWGSQVQFIVAYDQITKEGYRLMAIDEGKTGGQASGGFTGGVNAYFYFQKMDFVR